MKKYFVLLLSFVLAFGLTACSDAETEKAKSSFEETASIVEKNNETINKDVKALQKLTKSKVKPLDDTVLKTARETISQAKQQIVEVPECPSKKEDIKEANKKLKKKLDYTIDLMGKQCDSILREEDSIAQRKQVTNPSESFVLERLNGIPNVSQALAVNEENDVNGMLHKAGGYTSAIFFTSDLVDTAANYIEDGDSIEKGTDGGGCIEVFETEEDAQKRDTYLSAFDGGGMLCSGSHKVVGTVIIRTSNYLTATQQNDITTNIMNSLIALK